MKGSATEMVSDTFSALGPNPMAKPATRTSTRNRGLIGLLVDFLAKSLMFRIDLREFHLELCENVINISHHCFSLGRGFFSKNDEIEKHPQ
jgi:hypothetical protein